MPAPVNPGVTKPFQMPDSFQLPKTEEWSIPPILTGDPGSMQDNAIRLRQGIVCEVRLNTEWLFQNINDNEDDVVDFSLHGDPTGIWGKMNPRSFIRATTPVYFINRTDKDVLYLASFKQNSL